MALLYGGTIFCSSLLLLLVQPMMAKALLPWFGGSAGVWTCAMLFFQAGLLGGYAYAHGATRYLRSRSQTFVHLALLAASLAALPIVPLESWKPAVGAGSPLIRLLGILAVSVGLPYLMLSATTPLVQAWYARRFKALLPYRLFAVSNAASMAALLAYPFVLEPLFPTRGQLLGWSFAYCGFVMLAGTVALLSRGSSDPDAVAPEAPTMSAGLLWLALAACPSVLWMGVANTLSQNVAPVPLLWILPFTIYLLTLVLCFGREAWYRPGLFRVLLPGGWVVMAVGLARPGTLGIGWTIFFLSIGLFVTCMFCHGELARRKPPAPQLTSYYLMLAAGGAAGGLFVAVLAPLLFQTFLELPIGVVGSVLLALRWLYRVRARQVVRLALISAVGFVIATQMDAVLAHSVVRVRNFYGALQVSDQGDVRVLSNGPIRHGAELLAPDQRREPIAYYGPDSGIALVIRFLADRPERVGIIGLGAGGLAAYCRPGDSYRFFEINPAVIQVANQDFDFLRTCPNCSEIAGDGRLALESEPGPFDIVVVDAFSGDSIPTHLLTREAFRLYFSRLQPNGALVLNVTNRYLDLGPAVAAAARSLDWPARVVRSAADPARNLYSATWIVVTRNQRLLQQLTPVSEAAPVRAGFRVWTDDYSNLLAVLR